MHSFRLDSQFDPSDVDVAPIDGSLHAYNNRSADLAAGSKVFAKVDRSSSCANR